MQTVLPRVLVVSSVWLAVGLCPACADDPGTGSQLPGADTPDDTGSGAPDATVGEDGGLPSQRTLFVGNSYTSANGLPDVYRALVADRVTPTVEMVAYGAYNIHDHQLDAEGTGGNPQLRTLLGVGSTPQPWNHVIVAFPRIR